MKNIYEHHSPDQRLIVLTGLSKVLKRPLTMCSTNAKVIYLEPYLQQNKISQQGRGCYWDSGWARIAHLVQETSELLILEVS